MRRLVKRMVAAFMLDVEGIIASLFQRLMAKRFGLELGVMVEVAIHSEEPEELEE